MKTGLSIKGREKATTLSQQLAGYEGIEDKGIGYLILHKT